MKETRKDRIAGGFGDHAGAQHRARKRIIAPVNSEGLIASVVLILVVVVSDNENQALIIVYLFWILPVRYHVVYLFLPNAQTEPCGCLAQIMPERSEEKA